MRIAIGSLMQETNTFAPVRATVETFRAMYLHRGEAMLTGFGPARVEVPGFLDVLRSAGVEPVPLLAAHAGSSGLVLRSDFGCLLDEMADRLMQAGPVDGLLLALHGAMVVEDEPDAESEIIARLRAVLPPGTPVGVSLDLHGHITAAMLQPDTVLIGYRNYPHTDMFETGQRVARLLLDMVRTGSRPAMALAKCPMLVSPVAARSDSGALRDLLAEARRHEAEGAVLHASLFPVQPWLDVPGLGFAALACAATPAAANNVARHLADLAWAARDAFEPDLMPLDDAIRTGLAASGLTVVGDGGDAPSSGAAADNAGVLRALLAAGADLAPRLTYLTLVDPAAVYGADTAGIGATVTLRVGHTRTSDGIPVRVTGTVRTLTDGTFVMHDPGSEGGTAQMGPTAVLAIGSLRLALRSRPAFEWDTGIYTSVGLDLHLRRLGPAGRRDGVREVALALSHKLWSACRPHHCRRHAGCGLRQHAPPRVAPGHPAAAPARRCCAKTRDARPIERNLLRRCRRGRRCSLISPAMQRSALSVTPRLRDFRGLRHTADLARVDACRGVGAWLRRHALRGRTPAAWRRAAGVACFASSALRAICA